MIMYAYEREDGHYFSKTKGETMTAARLYSKEMSKVVEVKKCELSTANSQKELLVVAANRLFDSVDVYSMFKNGKTVKGYPNK